VVNWEKSGIVSGERQGSSQTDRMFSLNIKLEVDNSRTGGGDT
jgi:hypothetical protein